MVVKFNKFEVLKSEDGTFSKRAPFQNFNKATISNYIKYEVLLIILQDWKRN